LTPYVEHRPFIVIKTGNSLGNVLNFESRTNIGGDKPRLIVNHNDAQLSRFLELENGQCAWRIFGVTRLSGHNDLLCVLFNNRPCSEGDRALEHMHKAMPTAFPLRVLYRCPLPGHRKTMDVKKPHV